MSNVPVIVTEEDRGAAIEKAARMLLWFQNHEHAEVSDAKEAWEALSDALDVPAPPARIDATSTLQDQVEAYREALEPFAVMGRMLIGSPFGEALFPNENSIGLTGNWSEDGAHRTITYGDLRRAALTQKDISR